MLLDIPTEQIQTTVEQCAQELLAEAGSSGRRLTRFY